MGKILCTVLVGFLFPLCVYSQTLNTSYNLPRSGDKLMKCQITTIQPNKGGSQQVWDFTDIKLQDANYELKYEAQGNDTIIATEHRTMYYYQKSGDSLFCIGYENPTTFIIYQKPELLLTFPISQGYTVYDYFEGKGNYCNYLNIHLRGKTTITADASGKLILPDGDTIQNVLRTYTHKYIHQQTQPQKKLDNSSYIDTIPFTINKDSIDYLIANDSVHIEMEIWRWYASGYRYPIFETIKSTIYKLGTPYEHFSTSFAYMPSEQYYDLPYDAENQRQREIKQQGKDWKEERDNKDIPNILIDYQIQVYNNDLQVYYELKESSHISIILYNIQGEQLSAIQKYNQSSGVYNEIIKIGDYPKGKYILQIVVGNKKYGEKVIKK